MPDHHESDLEAVRAMFTRAGVVFEEHRIGDEYADWDDFRRDSHTQLSVNEGAGPRNLGYGGFVSVLFFDAQGALMGMGAWE